MLDIICEEIKLKLSDPTLEEKLEDLKEIADYNIRYCRERVGGNRKGYNYYMYEIEFFPKKSILEEAFGNRESSWIDNLFSKETLSRIENIRFYAEVLPEAIKVLIENNKGLLSEIYTSMVLSVASFSKIVGAGIDYKVNEKEGTHVFGTVYKNGDARVVMFNPFYYPPLKLIVGSRDKKRVEEMTKEVLSNPDLYEGLKIFISYYVNRLAFLTLNAIHSKEYKSEFQNIPNVR